MHPFASPSFGRLWHCCSLAGLRGRARISRSRRAPDVSGYTATAARRPPRPRPDVTGGEAQRFASGGDIAGDWWTLFHSKPLNDLIEQSLDEQSRSQGGAGGACAWRARMSWRSAALIYPSVTAGFRASRQQQSRRAGAGAQQQRLSIQSLHAAAQRFLCARCLRPEPPHRGVAARRRNEAARYPDDRDLHHADRQCGGHGDPGGVDCRRRSTPPRS